MTPSVKILISGPIRPDDESVCNVIATIKRQFPSTQTFLCTWAGQLTDTVKSVVDFAIEVPEPTDACIRDTVWARTRQQREVGAELEGWTYSIYRMFHGVQSVCSFARPYCNDNDLTIRIRTDTIFAFDPSYIETICSQAKTSYVVRNRKSSGIGFDDWFAMATFKTIQSAWSLPDYNAAVSMAWNAEDVLYQNIRAKNISVSFLDDSRLECYIVRANRQRNYHP